MKYRYIYIDELVTGNKTQFIKNVSHVSIDSMYVRQENIYVLMNIVMENIILFIEPQFETVILVVLRDAL